MSNIIKFATFGPNRGLSLSIGAYEFIDGICEVQEKDAAAAASILTRYHDVCYAHELEQKIAEYDSAQQNKAAAASNSPQPETPPAPPTKPEPAPEAPKPAPEPAEAPPAPENPEPAPAAEKESPATDGEPVAEKEAPAEGEEKKRGAHKKHKQHADA